LYGDRIISLEKQQSPHKRNQKSLPEAALDLYLLSKTKCVLYGVGTFGYAAHILSGNPGYNILSVNNKMTLFLDPIRGAPLPNCNILANQVIDNERLRLQ
jgi:hypothetical protein